MLTFTSYISLEEANAYFIATGQMEWSGEDFTDEQRESALVRATGFIDAIGEGQWKGKKTTAEQTTAFPRKGLTDSDGYAVQPTEIPYNIKKATAEAGLKILNGIDLFPDVQNIRRERVEGAVSVEYSETGQTLPRYTYINSLISPYMTTNLNNGTSYKVITRGFANGSL